MKREVCSSILAVILAVVCLFGQACSDNSDKKEEGISYMTVYGDNDVLSDELSIFNNRTVNLYDKDNLHPYFDDSVLPERTETIFGNEIELQYRYSIKRYGHLLDYYSSADESFGVDYQRTTGKILLMLDQTKQIGEPEYTEEMIKTATDFVKSNWKIFQDDNFSTGFVKEAATNTTGVQIVRRVNGIVTDEFVIVRFSPQGKIVGWNEFLRYPDGIPRVMQDAIANLDFDLCKKSVAQYVSECAKKSSKKSMKIEEGSEWFEIVFGDNGKLALRVGTKILTDGETISKRFLIMIPYDGQPTEEDEKATTEQPDALPVVTDEDHVTSVLTETAVTQPETTENLETIPAEEAIE